MVTSVNYGKSAYSRTGYGKMRDRKTVEKTPRKHSERGQVRWSPEKRMNNYELREALSSVYP